LGYTHHNKINNLGLHLHSYEERYFQGGTIKGGRMKLGMLLSPSQVKFSSPPLDALIREIRDVLATCY
jgi:hypothetical protein